MKILFALITILATNLSADSLDEMTLDKAQMLMSEGKLTSVELTQYYLDKIKQYDKKLKSVGQVNNHALKDAERLDRERKSGHVRGPLHGVPVLIKDNIATADGMANTAGSLALKNNFPDKDAFLIQKLRQAGAIILGKANLSEWANFRSEKSRSGWTGLYGQSRNPYNLSKSPCGSSSGSGIATAANLTLLAIGTETDGSVTCPSAVNGIVGIKPSLGLVSRSGIIPLAHSQDTAGPMARTVTDAVMLLEVMAGYDKHDPASKKLPTNFHQYLKKNGLKGKRIGIVRNLMGYDNGVDELFEQQIKRLKDQGAIIVDKANIETVGKWDDDEYQVLLMEFKTDINNYLKNKPVLKVHSLSDLIAFNIKHKKQEMPLFGQDIFIKADKTKGTDSKNYQQHLKNAKRLAGAEGIDATLKKYQLDLLIAPTTGPAWSIVPDKKDHYLGSSWSAAAVAGYPHITVPMGFVNDLPVGLSFFSGFGKEGTLIEAAYNYEQASLARKSPRLSL